MVAPAGPRKVAVRTPRLPALHPAPSPTMEVRSKVVGATATAWWRIRRSRGRPFVVMWTVRVDQLQARDPCPSPSPRHNPMLPALHRVQRPPVGQRPPHRGSVHSPWYRPSTGQCPYLPACCSCCSQGQEADLYHQRHQLPRPHPPRPALALVLPFYVPRWYSPWSVERRP